MVVEEWHTDCLNEVIQASVLYLYIELWSRLLVPRVVDLAQIEKSPPSTSLPFFFFLSVTTLSRRLALGLDGSATLGLRR